jgi:fatty-acyl-CoA synthase
MIHGDILGERARLTPDRTALVLIDSGERLTYRQLDERAARCARVWRERLGLAKGDRVGILAHNRAEYVEAFCAAGKTGIVLVTMGTRLTAHELSHIVADSGMRALVYDGAFAETVTALRELVDVAHWVALDEPAAPADLRHGELAAGLGAGGFERERCDPEDAYALLYTSGTTGAPKGVVIPHRQVAWNGYNTAVSWQLRQDDVSPIFTPLYHAGGLMAFLTPLFTVGGTVVLHGGFDVGEIWRTLEAEGCTVVLGVPTIWKMLMEAPEFATTDLSRVRAFYSGGAPLPHYIIEAYQERGVVFKQGFGMTEVGVNCFSMTAEESRRKIGSIGKPLMFTEVRLVDGAGGEVGVDEVGELLFRGPHVCRGYWHNPEATAAALDEEGWFHTGDLARRDAEGFFYVAGRSKEMIISGGVNIYPAEIEAALLLHPDVADAAVVALPDEQWGEVGVAFVVPLEGRELAPEGLTAHLAERLAKFKIPKRFELIDELPRTAYGKVVKGELRDRLLGAGS